MKTPLLASCALIAVLASSPIAQGESLLAGGVVAPDGILESSFNPLSGEITSIRISSGAYAITLTKPKAFTGATVSDFLMETTIRSDQPGDTLSGGKITSVNDDSVTVDVRIRDVEVAVPPFGAGEPKDGKFNFLLRRVAPDSIVAEPQSRFLLMAACIDLGGSSHPSLAIDRDEFHSERLGEGDYRVTINGTGAFIDDRPEDYLIFLSPRSFHWVYADGDKSVRGEVEDVSDPDSVAFRIRTDDLHANPTLSDESTPSDQSFSMAVYRITSDEFNSPARSRRVAGMVLHNESTVFAQSVFPNGVVYVTETGIGSYVVGFHSVNAFKDVSNVRYLPFVYDCDGNESSELLVSRVVVENANSLSVEVKAYDVETSRGSSGTPVRARFGLVLYDTQNNARLDGTIGFNAANQKGRGIVNATGHGQTLISRFARTGEMRYFFAVNNDGNSTEGLRIVQTLPRSRLIGFSRISGNRTNLTTLVRARAPVSQDFRPGERLVFEVLFKSRKPMTRRSIGRLRAISATDATASDTVRFIIRP